MPNFTDFFDEADIYVAAGRGGDGSVHFRHEKYVPLGGPDGGDGGAGGSVILEADPTVNTLQAFRFKRRFIASPGSPGMGSRKHGKRAADVVVKVPLGTIVVDMDTGDLIADLRESGEQLAVARGGQGGLGNQHFATSTRQAPAFAEKGQPGQEKDLHLELKLVADVGLVGLPNAGKSTLLAAMSAARPKIADYPFTTLTPNLGVVATEDSSFVVADIPGLIEGAHEGHGLGDRFLRHIERTRVLVRVLDTSTETLRHDFDQVTEELRLYDDDLVDKPQIVALNKMDLPDAQANAPAITKMLESADFVVVRVSGATREGINPLIGAISRILAEIGIREPIVDDEPVKEIVYREPARDEFTIERKRATFYVAGRTVERMVSMTDMESVDGLERLQRQLKRIGVTQALERDGVRPGSRVTIGDTELVWAGELEPGVEPAGASKPSARKDGGSRRQSSPGTPASRGRRSR
jgi:GTP-binding protein